MFVTSISISRDGYYSSYGGDKPDPSKPFNCHITVHGSHGKVELKLDPAMSERIVAIIADEIAAAGRATAEALTAKCLEVKALPAKGAK